MYLGLTDKEWEKTMNEIRSNNQAFINIQGLDTEDDNDSWRDDKTERDDLADRRADADQTRGF